MTIMVSIEYIAYAKIRVTTPYYQNIVTLAKGNNHIIKGADLIWFPDDGELCVIVDRKTTIMPKNTRQLIFRIEK
jgi:hypothetical protein